MGLVERESLEVLKEFEDFEWNDDYDSLILDLSNNKQ